MVGRISGRRRSVTSSPTALERALKAYDKERLHAAATSVVAENVGYKSAHNGAALTRSLPCDISDCWNARRMDSWLLRKTSSHASLRLMTAIGEPR